MSDRVGFHFEGQHLEAEVRNGLPGAIYHEDIEIEPTLEMIKLATTVVRRQARETREESRR